MSVRIFKRIFIVILFAVISGIVSLNAQHYAKGTIFESALDPIIPYVQKILSFISSPRVILLATLLAGMALGVWAELVRKQWISRNRSFFRGRLAMTFMLISGSCFVVSLLWYTAEKFLARKSDPSQINTIASSDDGLTPEQRQRKWLLEMRGKMEIAVKNAAGTPVSVIFEKSPPTKQITMMFDNKEYQIGTSMCGATSVWIYGSPPSVRSYTVKTAVKDRPIDVRSLRENRDSDAIQIGERAFFKFDDGRTAQLLLVGVQYYAAGDDIDEARFKYKIYEEGEFLIDPL